MKYVPSLSPPWVGMETRLEVKTLAGIRRAKPVQARTLPLLVVQPHSQREGEPNITDLLNIALRHGHYLRSFAYRFIELCSPKLDEVTIRAGFT